MKRPEKDMRNNSKKLTQIGFFIKDLGPNQLAYTCISSINNWLEKQYGIDPVLFFEEQSTTCLQPRCARFNVCDTSHYYGNLICTHIDGVINTSNATVSKRFFYIYDLEYLKSDQNKQKFHQIMQDKSIIKFTRCIDYIKKIKSDGYEIYDTPIDDFNISQIIHLIKDSK